MATIELDPVPVAVPGRPQRRAGILSVLALVGALGVTFAPVSTQPTQRIVIEQTSDQNGYQCQITVNGNTVVAEASTVAPPDCRWPR